VFAASAAGVAADFPQAELLIYPELYLCGLNGRAEERVPGSQARWHSHGPSNCGAHGSLVGRPGGKMFSRQRCRLGRLREFGR